jgi:hypothetical protein
LIVRAESRAACVRFPTWKYQEAYCGFIRERILLRLSSEQHEPEPDMTTNLEFLSKEARGLNLCDSDDRAIFRERVARALRATTLAAMREWTGKALTRRADGTRAVADAYIDTCTPSVKWKALVAKAEETGNWPIRSAYMSAEGNAADTFAETGRADDLMDPRAADALAELAFGSLCCTEHFQEDAAVRAFYEAAGYRW